MNGLSVHRSESRTFSTCDSRVREVYFNEALSAEGNQQFLNHKLRCLICCVNLCAFRQRLTANKNLEASCTPVRRQITALILLLGCFVSVIAQMTPSGDRPLLGFDRASTASERALEARFDAALRRENLRDWLKRLSAHPHHIGSPYGKANAEFIASQFKGVGI
jgi:hypothetical protein